MSSPAPAPEKTKICPRCSKGLPLTAFGINNAAADGRNCYCRECVTSKQQERRAQLKAMAEGKLPLPPPPPPRSLPLEERVFQVIVAGASTYTEIALALNDFPPSVRIALAKSETLREKLVFDEEGRTLNVREIGLQQLLLRDEIGDAICDLINEGRIRTNRLSGRTRYQAVNRAPVSLHRRDQGSLFGLLMTLGPKVTGISTQRGRVEPRERRAVEGSARSRAA